MFFDIINKIRNIIKWWCSNIRKDLKQFLGLKVNAIAKFEKYGLVYNDSATRYIKDKRSYRILLKNIIIEHKGERRRL